MAEKILVYHLWPLSWGNLRIMSAFLPRIKALGADYVWLSPIFSSPWKNHGYDISDYYSIDPRFGTLDDFREFVNAAHAMGLKVITDLVIDSTSIEHVWYQTDLNRYIWSRQSPPDWRNLYDQGSAWEYDNAKGHYYLHLGHPAQADLNWYFGGVLNRQLTDYFKTVMCYWLKEFDVDGFRLGSIQSLNKEITQDNFGLDNFLIGHKAVEAIGELSNIYRGKTPFLMLDCIDPYHGDVVDYYAENIDVEFITNSVLRSSIALHQPDAARVLSDKLAAHVKNHKFMLELESHDSSRFTSRFNLNGKEAIDLIFGVGAQAVCLYQGQELGLENPSEHDLSMAEIMKLDSRAVAQLERHATIESIRQTSHANVRLPLPLDEYARQEADDRSVLAHTKEAIQRWKNQ